MKKAILISIRPEFVEKILNGEKTIEIRKNYPKCDIPIDVFIYCTKGTKNNIYDMGKHGAFAAYGNRFIYEKDTIIDKSKQINKKVVAKFTLNKINPATFGRLYIEKSIEFAKKACLLDYELIEYVNGNNTYAWHIDDLVILDRPMELCDFNKIACILGRPDKCSQFRSGMKRPPQSWQYVEVADD